MKIGPLDISYRTLIYVGMIVAGIISLLVLWGARSDVRAENLYRDTIMKGLYAESPEVVNAAVEAAQKVIGYSPQRVDCRLYLGSLLYRQKEFKGAQKAFEDAAALPGATAQQKAWAYCGAGASCYSAAIADKVDATKAAADAEKFYKQALEQKLDNKKGGDALAGLAILNILRGKDGRAEAQKYVDQAMNAPDTASLRVEAQLQNVRGILLIDQGRSTDAWTAFTAAQALRPDREEFAENRKLAALLLVNDKGLSEKQRLDNLHMVEKNVATYGKQQCTAWNIIGRAYASMKSTPEVYKASYESAQQAFNKAAATDATDLRAYRNRGVLFEERIAMTGATLKRQVTGINGETPPLNIWAPGQPAKFGPEDAVAIMEIRKLLTEEDAMWTAALQKVTQTADKVDFKVRQLACIRRLFWLMPENDPTAPAVLEKAAKLSAEIVALDPKSGVGQFTRGLVLIDKGDLPGALAAMTEAKTNGYDAPNLDELIAGLTRKPKIGEIRPGARRAFGMVPLISASLHAPAGGIKETKMSIDDKPVEALVSGTQVLYVPEQSSSLDGDHTVKISIIDKKGNTIDFPEFNFGVDKKPPSIKITPEGGAVLPAKAEWTITVGDASGIDPSSTSVVFKTVKGAQSITRELVKDGKYKLGFPDLKPPIKAGSAVGETFRVAPGQDLLPGEYTLTITVGDIVGNVETQTKSFTVNKPEK